MLFRRTRQLDDRLVTLVNPRSFEADQFRRLRHRVEDMKETRGVRVIAVTSAAASDGKTLTAINLAGALAASARVLLIDADLRQPSLAKVLSLDRTHGGLVGALRDGAGMIEAFVQPAGDRALDVLASEAPQPNPYELLRSSAFARLVNRAREVYDFVLIDTAPILPVPDAGLIARSIDGYLVVISADGTPRKLVGEALNLLKPTNVLGLVFNRDRYPLFGYRSRYQDYFAAYGRSVGDRSA